MLRGSALFLLPAMLFGSASAQDRDAEKLAPYYPTPLTIVQKMLELGGLKPGEKMFDLGSGDGRIVIMAAQKFGADAPASRWSTTFTTRAWRRSGNSAS